MHPTPARAGRRIVVEVLRWICVLPAAFLAEFAVQVITTLVPQGDMFKWGDASPSPIVFALQLLVAYTIPKAAAVVAGAKMAPRFRLATSIVLAASVTLMTLSDHVIFQSNPGITNYSHFTAETAGAVFGAAYIFYSEKVRPRKAIEIGHP
jgi:hypothetical protein